jgi:hypothetical protein
MAFVDFTEQGHILELFDDGRGFLLSLRILTVDYKGRKNGFEVDV